MGIFTFMAKLHNVNPGFWGSLVRANTGVSSLNFYLIMTTLVGIALLSLVIFAVGWEVIHNNTVQSDISGWAQFVGAVATLFASAGIAKGWSNWSENKFTNYTENEVNCDTEESLDGNGEVAYEDTPVAVRKASRKNSKKRNCR